MSLSIRVEDYLRIIYEIEQEKGYARVKDIANRLGVKRSSVVEMMKKLSSEGYIVYNLREPVRLTPSGREIAGLVKKRQETFQKFLEALLIPREIASRDSHILEHQLHEETVKRILEFVEFVTETEAGEKLLEEFKKYTSKK
ncbi:MAG: metal-dependent transcriptional regulator [Infirmifilum sp.]